MRARNIKPGICDNEVLGTADPFITLLFERLWMMADRAGRLEDRPLRIKAQAFPYRDGLEVEPMLDWLQAKKFIVRYCVDDSRYIQIIEFKKHQKPHKNEQPSVLPPYEKEPKSVESTALVVPANDQGSSGEQPRQLHGRSDSLIASCLIADSHTEGARDHFQNFEALKTSYPKFAGRQDWIQAEMYCRNRIDDGETWLTLKAAVERFATYCRATRREGTNFVMSPGKFFSAADEPWKQPWDPPTERQNPSQTQGAFARIMAANGGSHDD